jgi:hypothetical protein
MIHVIAGMTIFNRPYILFFLDALSQSVNKNNNSIITNNIDASINIKPIRK